MPSMIGDMLVVGVEATTTPFGFSLTMLVRALLCLWQFSKQLQFFFAFQDEIIPMLHVTAGDHWAWKKGPSYYGFE